jgi:predicted amidophosphoribosyltransferase
MVETVASAPWRSRVEAVVFVPSLWRRRVLRPYYAAESLARLVAGGTRLPQLPLLRRIRGGSHQIGLSFPQRVENVRGAFAMARGATLQRAKLLLIDDVMTTGATLNECAKVLRRAGAEEVYGAVVVTVDANRTPEALRSF